MNNTEILENLTQCRVELRAAIIELDRVRPEKRNKITPARQPRDMISNGKKVKAVAR